MHKQAVLVTIVMIAGAIVVVGGVALIGNAFLIHGGSVGAPVACRTAGNNHIVRIEHGVPSPAHTTARLCDTLTITNEDTAIRLIAFGSHEHHVAYDGVTEQAVGPGASVRVVLNQAGTFSYHDHLNDSVRGDFTVAQ